MPTSYFTDRNSPYAPPPLSSFLADYLQGSGKNLRNLGLSSLFSQLYGPSMEGLYETGPVDQAAQQYRGTQQAQAEGLYGRGLQRSGAVDITNRGLSRAYGGALSSAVQAGGQAETARKQALLTQLLGVGQSDLGSLRNLFGATTQAKGAAASNSLTDLMSSLNLAHGAAIIASILVGGAAGGAGAGAGGAAGGGAAGAAAGAAQGLTLANQLWGGGGGGAQNPFQTSTPTTQPGQSPAVAQAVPEGGMSAYNPTFQNLLYQGGYGGGQ